jgi:hypothetical protein
MVEQTSVHEVSKAVDELIEAHERLRASEGLIVDYSAHNALPQTPELFENIEALLRYNAQKERYQRGLRRVMEQRASRIADYERATLLVEPLLPEGVRLIHAYGGSSAIIPAGKRYSLFKEIALTELSEGTPLETTTGDVSAMSYVVRVEEESV